MGKKSSSKKQKRIAEQSGDSAKNKKSKGHLLSRLEMKIWAREKWLATGLMVVALLVLGLATFISWQRLMAPKSISLFVPRDTVAMAEIDTDFADSQWQNMSGNIADLVHAIDTTFQVNFTNDVYPWLARRAGIAMLSNFKPAIFLEVKDEKQALAFFQNRQLQGAQDATTQQLKDSEYRGVMLHEYAESSPFTFMMLGRYFIAASDESVAKSIIDASNDKSGALYDQYAFQRVKNSFSGDHVAFLYGKPSYFTNLIPGLKGPEDGLLSSIFSGEGVSIKALKDMIAIEHMAFFNDDIRGKKEFLKIPKKYRTNLAEFFSPDVTFFAGGENLSLVFEKFATLLATKDMTTEAITAGLTIKVSQLVGGGNASGLIVKSMTDLAKNEYAFGIDHGAIKIALQVSEEGAQEMSREETQKTEQKIKQFVAALQALPDLQRETVSWKMVGNVAVITSTPDELTKTLALWSDAKQSSLKYSAAYSRIIEPQMQSADDIIYMKPVALGSLIPEPFTLLGSISEMSIASTAFEDGMKTTVLISQPQSQPPQS